MNKLSLDAFKAKMSQDDITKTDALIGGILGACHPKPDDDMPKLRPTMGGI